MINTDINIKQLQVKCQQEVIGISLTWTRKYSSDDHALPRKAHPDLNSITNKLDENGEKLQAYNYSKRQIKKNK